MIRSGRAGGLLTAFTLYLALALALRLGVLFALSSRVLGCRLCVLPNVLAADALYLAGALALFLLSLLSNALLWRFLWRGLALAAVWLYVIDAGVMAQFNTRLMLADIRVYTADVSLATGLLAQLPAWQLGSLVLMVLASVWLWWLPLRARLRARQLLPWIAGVLAVGWLFPWVLSPAPYVNEWAVRNVVSVNLPTGIATPYAEKTQRHLRQTLPAMSCRRGEARRQHVVLLVLESWSTYQSQRWLGEHDWTPRLDALAGQGVWFSQLYAGGHNTNAGLVSLLAGKEITLPVLPAHNTEAFAGAWALNTSLPEQLNTEGYHTAFLTSGDLSYTRKGEWLSSLGFDEIRGNEAPAFEGQERLHFGGVADDALYDYAWRKLNVQRERGEPTLTVVENISSHQPYVQPETGEKSEEAVFRYMDSTAADFLERLLDDDFLDEGMVIVVSDHRAMTFMTAAEEERFGTSAAARIPGFVLGAGVPESEITAAVHQADIMPGVLERVGQRVCSRQAPRAVLSGRPITPRCLLHARGDRREQVDVFCPEGQGRVEVDGDNSRFIRSSGIPAAKRRHVLDTIARERLLLVP